MKKETEVNKGTLLLLLLLLFDGVDTGFDVAFPGESERMLSEEKLLLVKVFK